MAHDKKTQAPVTSVTPAVPDGYKSTRGEGAGELHEIVKLEEGQYLEGHYYGIKILPSNYSADGSILWQIKCNDGEIRLINEKTTMKDIRLKHLREGQAVLIMNNGYVDGKKARYLDFEVFIKE